MERNEPALHRGYGKATPKLSFGKRLLKCSKCPGSDIVDEMSSPKTEGYVCWRCREVEKNRKHDNI